ncbi:hypothetical protein V6N13_055180 [Hibiscus sabdariffa]
MAGFVSFVEEVGLLDLPAAGKVFVWFRAGLKTSRLYRFLVLPGCVEQFCGSEQFILQRGVSDHVPLRLSSSVVDWGPRPFRFLNCWLEKRGHVKLMESEWHRISEEASTSLSILEKLRRLKGFLKVWTRESFGSVDLQIEGNLWKLLKCRSSIWRQKLWVLWLREGDRNTRFFQKATKI